MSARRRSVRSVTAAVAGWKAENCDTTGGAWGPSREATWISCLMLRKVLPEIVIATRTFFILIVNFIVFLWRWEKLYHLSWLRSLQPIKIHQTIKIPSKSPSNIQNSNKKPTAIHKSPTNIKQKQPQFEFEHVWTFICSGGSCCTRPSLASYRSRSGSNLHGMWAWPMVVNGQVPRVTADGSGG